MTRNDNDRQVDSQWGWWQGMTMIDNCIVDVVDNYKNGGQVESRHCWWWQWE